MRPDFSYLDKPYRSADVDRRENLPDGKFHVRIERVYLDEPKPDRPCLRYDLKVIAGHFQGRMIFKTAWLTPKAMGLYKRDISRLKLDIPPSELPDRLGEFLDILVEVTLKTNGEYQNVYFDKRLDSADVGPEDFGDDDPDDTPF